MADDPTATGGTGGEPAEPVAPSSPSSDAELLASLEPGKEQQPDPNAEFWEKAKDMDFTKAPDDIRAKIEAPFLSLSGKKINEVEQLRQTFLSAIDKLAARNGAPAEPTVDQRAVLRDKIAEGDFSAVDSLVEEIVNQRVGPQMDFISKTRSIQEAAEMMPELPKYEAQVAEALQQDPALLQMTAMNNRQFASRVLAGLAWRAHALTLQQELAKVKADTDARIKAGIAAEQARIKGLPTSTSQAGRGPTGYPPSKPMSMEEIRDAAWAAGGGQ